jgi:peptide/nickel transport system permease protein
MAPAGKTARYILALFIILSLNFAIPRAMPGDTLTNLLGEDVAVSDSSQEELKREMGLDQPLSIQYLSYWQDLLRMDLGYSYHLHSAVSGLILARMRWTLLLVAPSIILGALVGTFLGALAGWRSRDQAFRLQTYAFLLAYCSPPYFLALIVLYVFGFQLACFPLKGFYETGSAWDVLHHLFLPVIVMTLFSASRNYMIMRGSVLQERQMLYAAYARAKGLYGDQILFRHVFKNAVLPIIALVALDFGFIFSGALFIEIVFSMHGMGNLIYDALLCRDYPVLQGSFLIITLMVVTANFLSDCVYGMVDPRVRWGRGE